jgi:hypothetical protein
MRLILGAASNIDALIEDIRHQALRVAKSTDGFNGPF